jgi:hypothetical protein
MLPKSISNLRRSFSLSRSQILTTDLNNWNTSKTMSTINVVSNRCCFLLNQIQRGVNDQNSPPFLRLFHNFLSSWQCFVGETATGKSALIRRLTKDDFQTEHMATIEETIPLVLDVEGKCDNKMMSNEVKWNDSIVNEHSCLRCPFSFHLVSQASRGTSQSRTLVEIPLPMLIIVRVSDIRKHIRKHTQKRHLLDSTNIHHRPFFFLLAWFEDVEGFVMCFTMQSKESLHLLSKILQDIGKYSNQKQPPKLVLVATKCERVCVENLSAVSALFIRSDNVVCSFSFRFSFFLL